MVPHECDIRIVYDVGNRIVPRAQAQETNVNAHNLTHEEELRPQRGSSDWGKRLRLQLASSIVRGQSDGSFGVIHLEKKMNSIIQNQASPGPLRTDLLNEGYIKVAQKNKGFSFCFC